MTLLASVKLRCGIPDSITIYDEPEMIPLIMDAIEEMRTAGVSSDLLPDTSAEEWYNSETAVDPRVITCIVFYVQECRGNDRNNTMRYRNLFRQKLFKLMLEPED